MDHPEVDGPLWLQALVVGLFLVALVAVPAWRLVAGAERNSEADAPFAELARGLGEAASSDGPLAANRRALRAIDAFETALEDGSPLRAATLPAVQRAMVTHGGVGNETVYVGCQGWLVLRDAYDAAVGPPFLDPDILSRRRNAGPSWREPPRPDPRPAILDVARQLRERHIELLIVVVPAKITVHPEALCDATVPPGAVRNPSLDPLLAELEAAGVGVVDATPILVDLRAEGTQAFLRTDSHWTPAAVDATARAVAERVAPFLERSGDAVWWTSAALRAEGRGDLHRQLRLPASAPLYAVEAVEVERVASTDGRLWQPDTGASVLLLGDSFTNVFSDPQLGWREAGGLAERVALHLGRPVDRLAVNAGSASEVRERLASDPARLEALERDVDIVVWQIAAREFARGDWRLVDWRLAD